MPDLSKYVPLKTVVSYVLDECDKSIAEFDKYWLLAFRGLVDIGYDISAEPLTVRLPKNGNQTVTLPADYLSWTKIGILNDRGEVSTLKINNALTTFRDNSPNRLDRLTPDVTDGFQPLLNTPFYLNYYYNGLYQPLFGVGGGLIQYGDCRVDEKNGVIVLQPDFKYDSIILEYISVPQKNGDYQIETLCQEALISFIKWKAKLGTYEEYIGAKINARRRLPNKKATLQTINQVIRESEAMKLRS